MKAKQCSIKIILIMTLIMCGIGLSKQTEAKELTESEDKTESPYFFVQSDDPQIDQLPLKSTHVTVSISGVMADVTVTQVYENKGTRPIEAIYIFPASTKAAVYGMKMTIGERIIIAKIKKTQEARDDYEAAKAAGKTASLLEQHRPNVFQMNVANILPNDHVAVELKYTELMVPTDKIYEFMYPTVVGPRYNTDPGADPSKTNPWVSNPYLGQGALSPSMFDIQINLNGGVPVKDMTCKTHKVNIDFKTVNNAGIKLDDSEKNGGNRDFILKYRLAGNKIQTGLLLSQQEKENFFLMMIQPPERVQTEDIPPREYIFIVDVSGSMHGFPLDISKKLMKDLVGNLRPTDRFNMLMFSGGSSVLSPESLPATSENIKKAVSFIENQRGGGGTNLLPALKQAFEMSEDKGLSRTLIIATDGYVSVEEEAFDMIRNRLGDANLFAFGIGSSVNRHLIEGMARVGYGEPFVITQPEEASKIADDFRKLIQTPVLTDITLNFGDFEAYDVEPKTIPDVMADRPIMVFGKYKGQPKGSIIVTGLTGDRKFSHKVEVKSVKPEPGNDGLKYLWARHRIALLSDYIQLNPTDERINTVTQLGLDYSLLTAYTSFVAVDSEVRLENGKPVTVKQPLPLPQGVSNYAVGVAAPMVSSEMRVKSIPGFALYKGAVADQKVLRQEATVSEPDGLKTDKKTSRILKLEVSRGLIKEDIRKILNGLISEIDKCCAGYSGKTMTLIIEINASGQVLTVEISSKEAISKDLKNCVSQKVNNQVFPSNSKKGKITVSILI